MSQVMEADRREDESSPRGAKTPRSSAFLLVKGNKVPFKRREMFSKRWKTR